MVLTIWNRLSTFPNSSTLSNTYDTLGRVAIQELSNGTTTFDHVWNYNVISETQGNVIGRTSNQVNCIYYKKGDTEGTRIDYTYDANGNITAIYERPFTEDLPGVNDTPIVTYQYDQLNQLIYENNGYTGEVVSYTYDNRGNILSKSVTSNGITNVINYTYGDPNWKDKLTAYDGNAISYDAIGNPLSYDGWSFTWQKGRQLKTMSKGSTSLSFKYNENGIRTSKTVNGIETQYLLDGSTIIAQKTGNTTLWFYYDGDGKLTAMQNGDNGAVYYYAYNNQGDVIALLDSDFNFVANYTYDSWGKLVSVTGSNTTIGNLNPFRYRGYYYDSETELYYLNSRYYNPEIGRFINADKLIAQSGKTLKGCNLFCYGNNNPTNTLDSDGNWPKWVSDGAKIIWKRLKTVNAVVTSSTFELGIGTGLRSSVTSEQIEGSFGFKFDIFNIKLSASRGWDFGYEIKSGASLTCKPLGFFSVNSEHGYFHPHFCEGYDNQTEHPHYEETCPNAIIYDGTPTPEIEIVGAEAYLIFGFTAKSDGIMNILKKNSGGFGLNKRLNNNLERFNKNYAWQKFTPLVLFIVFLLMALAVNYYVDWARIERNGPIHLFLYWFAAGTFLIAAIWTLGNNIRGKHKKLGKFICFLAIFMWILGTLEAGFQLTYHVMNYVSP